MTKGMKGFQKGHIKYYSGGYKHLEVSKHNMSIHHKGKHHSPSTEFKKGDERLIGNKYRLGKPSWNKGMAGLMKPAWNKGGHWSEEVKNKLSKAHIGLMVGSKHPLWNGGTSFEPYSPDWKKTLKQSIRQRDNNFC